MKRSFTPRARLVSILGDQLIKDDVVGLLELVKNGYDADAKKVTVSIFNTMNPQETEIWVRDDGSGMDLETIENHWLQPASGHKEQAKRNLTRTQLGRLPQGEKGVGRFAVQRLGRYLTLTTRTENAPQEIVIQIDWSQFEDDSKRLAEVEFDVTLRAPVVFANGKGTLLQMKGTRTSWTEANIKKIHRYLERMMSPFEGASDFVVELECPEYPEYQVFNPTEITRHAHFTFSGSVDSNGALTFTYSSAVPGFEGRQVSGLADLIPTIKPADWGTADRKPTCGPFSIKVFGWYRRAEIMNRTPNVSVRELDQRCGIHVYRDGIRVLPYGEQGDDWLQLDLLRINRPDERLGNRNLIGMVEVKQDLNPDLRDKTNREGLVENQAFLDLRLLVRACVNQLEALFLHERIIITDAANARREAQRQELQRKCDEVLQTLEAWSGDRPSTGSTDTGTDQLPVRVRQQIVTILRDSDVLIREEREAYETERQALLSLAGLGFTAERFAHEFARQVNKAERSFAFIENRLGETDPNVMAVKSALDALRNEIRGLEPLMYVRRRKRNQTSNVMTAVDNAVLLNDSLADEANVKLRTTVAEDFSIRMNSGALTQVLNNLLDNAIYWTSCNRAGRERLVEIEVSEENSSIIIRDSGPGIPQYLGDTIFDPFVTRRDEGRGLGLWICRQILAEENCEIQLLPSDPKSNPLGGAAFVVKLARARAN